MAQLVKLWDEKELLIHLQSDTIVLIRDCKSIEPIKKFVECYDILKLTWSIQDKFPTEWPDTPECDEMALLQLKVLTQQLTTCHWPELPHPGFDVYSTKIIKLLRIFRVPKREYKDARPEFGEFPAEQQTTEEYMPYLLRLDGKPPGRKS